MMMMPSIFGGNLFNDDWMDFSFPDIDKELYGKHAKNLMKTDVKEKDGNYEVAIDLPGFKKDEITRRKHEQKLLCWQRYHRERYPR